MNLYAYTDELHIKSFRDETERSQAIMNRRKFLQSLAAIVPVSIAAQFSLKPVETSFIVCIRGRVGLSI